MRPLIELKQMIDLKTALYCKGAGIPNGLMTKGICLLSFSIIAGFAVANPAKSEMNISDGTAQGSEVTLSGSGFGGVNNPEPVIWDQVDNQSGYSAVGNGQVVPTNNGAPWTDVSGDIVVKRGGSQRHQYSDASYSSGGGKAFVGNPAGGGAKEELFLSYWVKFDRDPYERENAAAHKFVRIWGGDHQDLRVSWNVWGLGVSNRNAGGTSSSMAYGKPSANESVWEADTWHLHEVWVSTEEGRIRTWVDGKLRIDWENQDTRYLKTDHPNGPRVSLLGWNPAHGEGYVGDAKFEMDDILIQESRARVLLSQSEKWDDSSHHEYQPVSSWSDGEIEFDLNLGSLDRDGDLYVYVVNQDGEVNQEGFALEKCKECPEAPEDLNVE